jgi:hypothetical protein
MRSISALKSVIATALVAGALMVSAQPAKANWWYGGGWGPRFAVRVGPPCYRYYGPRPYYYAPGAYYGRGPYWGPRPYYYAPRHYYYAPPAIGFGIIVR